MNSITQLNRKDFAELIASKIVQEKDRIKTQYEVSKNKIGFFFIDDLLPPEITTYIYSHFPSHEDMVLKKSLREDKFIAVQMNQYASVLE